jgi:hypothetical protein
LAKSALDLGSLIELDEESLISRKINEEDIVFTKNLYNSI